MQVFLIFLIFKQILADDINLISSTYQVTELFKREQLFIRELKSYLSTLQNEVETVQNYIQEIYPNDDLETIENQEEYIAHPINALGVVHRTCWHTLQKLQTTNTIEEQRSKLLNLTKIFPNMQDYIVAAQSIALLQESYDLKTEDLANGIIFGHKSHFQVPIYAKMAIGAQAGNRKFLDSSTEWIQSALDHPNPNPELKKVAKQQMKELRAMHDQLLERRGPISGGHRTFPVPFDKKLKKKKKYKKIKNPKKLKSELIFQPLFDDDIRDGSPQKRSEDYNGNYRSLCQTYPAKEVVRNASLDQDLKCRFLHHSDPYLKIGPFLVEELNYDPWLMVVKGKYADLDIFASRTIVLKLFNLV